MESASYPLDPTIAALVPWSEQLGPVLPCSQYDTSWLAAAGAFFLTAFVMVAAQVAGTTVSAEQARGARRLAYCEGVVRPPRRPTAAQRHAAECRAWGFTS